MNKRVGAVLLIALAAAACTQPVSRSLRRYLDPQGLFSADLPIANDTTVSDPGTTLGPGIELLSGVTSSAPQTSTSTTFQGFGQQPPDQAIFLVWALSSKSITSTPDVTRLLSQDPSMDVEVSEPFRFADGDGALISGEYTTDQGSFGMAGGFLATGGLGYAVIEEFPSGQWATQEQNFKQILSSFRAPGPPGVNVVQLGAP